MPEFESYVEEDPMIAGEMTRKEAGYIAEIVTEVALREGKNVLVDGSLRDHEWYKGYFDRLRKDYPALRLAILHVVASEAVVFERARKRGEETGRHVPESVLRVASEQVRYERERRPTNSPTTLADSPPSPHRCPGVWRYSARS